MKIPSERNLTSADRIWSTFRLLLDFKLSKVSSSSSSWRIFVINCKKSLEKIAIVDASLGSI